MELRTETSKNGKIKIYADGEFLFTVNAVLWYSSSFRDGDEVEPEEIYVLKYEDEKHESFESAMRMLSLRAHSEFELRYKLKMKFNADAVDFAVDKLNGLGLLDDEKFSVMFAEELLRRKGYAPKRILIELKNRGIDSKIAENAVNGLYFDKEISIINVMEKMHLTDESTEKEKAKVIRRLLNMGYSYGDISKYIKGLEG